MERGRQGRRDGRRGSGARGVKGEGRRGWLHGGRERCRVQVNSWVEWKRESGGMQLRREGKECRRVGRMSGEEREVGKGDKR